MFCKIRPGFYHFLAQFHLNRLIKMRPPNGSSEKKLQIFSMCHPHPWCPDGVTWSMSKQIKVDIIFSSSISLGKEDRRAQKTAVSRCSVNLPPNVIEFIFQHTTQIMIHISLRIGKIAKYSSDSYFCISSADERVLLSKESEYFWLKSGDLERSFISVVAYQERHVVEITGKDFFRKISWKQIIAKLGKE